MTEHGEGLRPGTRIGEFEIVRELGAGGFGITYLAEDRSLGRRVAVKEYFPGDWGSRRADGTVGPRVSGSASDYAWGRQGPWTDIYALGALAYAALSGGRVPDDATERMREDRLEPVDAVATGPVSGELAGAVMSVLTTDYRQRPQAVGEWLAMLGNSRP